MRDFDRFIYSSEFLSGLATAVFRSFTPPLYPVVHLVAMDTAGSSPGSQVFISPSDTIWPEEQRIRDAVRCGWQRDMPRLSKLAVTDPPQAEKEQVTTFGWLVHQALTFENGSCHVSFCSAAACVFGHLAVVVIRFPQDAYDSFYRLQ